VGSQSTKYLGASWYTIIYYYTAFSIYIEILNLKDGDKVKIDPRIWCPRETLQF
jgi:hypothetical protein